MEKPTVIQGNWIEVKDGDPRAVGLFRHHYSCENKKANHTRYGFSGQGESMILMTIDCRALFGWRKLQFSDDGQTGVNCFIFHREAGLLASDLILEACEMAWQRWPGERLYTYVNPKKIDKHGDGYCFKKAGFKKCGHTKGGLIILEKYLMQAVLANPSTHFG